ncbi:Transcriptional regulatory protein, C terminal [Duganella sp. CF458]|uniref:nSTAND1 domain-containing NTPase n=1 Tax=Duganella sp. CF458 TaxID=1884368 RepID=UPI0008E84036|nr:winged helix-turn-helix domain-containing protein [Duganella sp. CF458]SFF74282.1 Transcriptional regulatory protein, C terminal [Duganella sp. CF458]
MEFQFGDWVVSPEANIVSNGDAKTQLEPRVMAVLRYLCRHPGAVIPAEEILQACWGSSELGDNPVHKAITQLRRAFGDSSTEPRYIETIRKRGYRAIAPVITFAAPPATTWESGSPFRGLEAFQENHSAIFFGRVQATAQLRELVLTQAAHGCPMALVLGPSGSGKTSLVRAGLLPQLMAGSIRSDEPIGLSSTVYLDCADLGSGTLFQALAGALIDAEINGEPLFPGASADSLGQRLASDPDAVSAELRERACQRTAVGVFVDRLEAVFRAQPGDANRFLQVLDALAKSNCLLILMACRNDFYPEVMAQPVLLALKSRGGHFDVLPPDGAEIAQIVRRPAVAANLSFERDEATGASLDDVLCDASRGNPDTLPLLQYCLNELYRLRSEEGQLKFAVYHELGGIDGAVGVRAEQVVGRLTVPQLDALPRVLSLLVNIGEDQASVTSRRSPLSMLRTEDERELVRVMVEARLFVSELAGEVPSFGVAHEALLRRWPRVSAWVEGHRQALQLCTRLRGQAERWEQAMRRPDLLLPQGMQTQQAAELLQLRDFAIAPLELEFIRHSISRAKLRERINITVVATILLLAVLATVLGLSARNAQRESEEHRIEAEGLMGYMLGEFVEKVRPLGRLELLDDVSARALQYLTATKYSTATPESLIQNAKALQVIAEVNVARANPAKAKEALLAARELLHSTGAPTNTEEHIKTLGANAYWLGSVYLIQREFETAAMYFTEYKRAGERWRSIAPENVDAIIELAYSHGNLGTVALRQGNLERASESFTTSIKLKEQALNKRKTEELTAGLANSIAGLASVKVRLGRLSEAFALYKQSEELLKELHSQSPNDATWQTRLSNTLRFQGELNIAMGQTAQGTQKYREASVILTRLVRQDSSNQEWFYTLAENQLRIIREEISSKDPLASLTNLDLLLKNISPTRTAEPQMARAGALKGRINSLKGEVLLMANRNSEALNSFDVATAELEKLLGKNKSDALLLENYALAQLGRAQARGWGKPESQQDCGQALLTLTRSNGDLRDYHFIVPKALAHRCLGNTVELAEERNKLTQIAYRDERYLRIISSQ